MMWYNYFELFGGAAVLATILTFITTALLKRSFKKREEIAEQRRADEEELRERRAKEAREAQLQLITQTIKEELKPVTDEMQQLYKHHDKDILALRKDLKALAKNIDKRLDKLEECNEDERKGLQDILKDRLYRLYWQCTNKGYADREDREIFESMYKSYHKLYANGVMDGYHKRFFDLPDHPEGI